MCACVCERERRRRGEREKTREIEAGIKSLWRQRLLSALAFKPEWKAHQHHCNQHNPPNQQRYNGITLHYALQVQRVEPGGGVSGGAGRTAGLGSLQPVR